jgi:hypothetical protein
VNLAAPLIALGRTFLAPEHLLLAVVGDPSPALSTP